MLFRGLVASAILLCQTHRAFDVPFSMAVQPVLPHDCSFCANSVHTQTPSFAVQCLSLQDALYIMLTVSHNCLSFVRFLFYRLTCNVNLNSALEQALLLQLFVLVHVYGCLLGESSCHDWYSLRCRSSRCFWCMPTPPECGSSRKPIAAK